MIKLSRRAMLAGLVATTALVSGCGFRLRGTGAVVGARYSAVVLQGLERLPPDLVAALREQLHGLGVSITDSLAQADVLIELGSYQRQVSRTAFSTTGETTAELIKLSQSFKAQRIVDEVEIINTQVMTLRDRQIDPNQLLAAARELEDIERQMQQDLARQLIDRLNRSYARLPAAIESPVTPTDVTP